MTSADVPRRPALTSTSNVLQVGGYPRNSSVYAANRWGPPGRPNLKQNPTSYFSLRPHPNSPSSTSPSPSHTPQFSPLQLPSPANFDIRFTVRSPGSPADSDFSTRAFAGTGSSRGASPLPSPLPTSLPESTPAGDTLQVPGISKTAPLSVDGTFLTDQDMHTKHDEKEKMRTSLDGSATAVSTSHGRKVKLHHTKTKSHSEDPAPAAAAAASNVVPLPSVAPFSSVLTSTGKTKTRSPSSSSSSQAQARRPSFASQTRADHLDLAPTSGLKEMPRGSEEVREDEMHEHEDGSEDAPAQTPQKYVFEPMPSAEREGGGKGKGKGVLGALKGKLRIGRKKAVEI